MRPYCHTVLLYCFILTLSGVYTMTPGALASTDDEPEALVGDAFWPPPPPPDLSHHEITAGPSQFMAGNVAVMLILPESNGRIDPVLEQWTSDQINHITTQVEEALDWWVERVPRARLRFQLETRIVPTAFEPIRYRQHEEGLWIGDVLRQMGYSGNYFEQAYAATYDLRRQTGSDWATLIFVANSANSPSGRFKDNRLGYAYINGPFTVLTSDVGSYGTQRLSMVLAHEIGHIFGAQDQYQAAQVRCDQRSGYLHMPTSNSQIGGCPLNEPSIMLSPIIAYSIGAVDPSALAQIGYHDRNGNGIIDPLDTTPELYLNPVEPLLPGQRPLIYGYSIDRGYPAPMQSTVNINRIERVEYRANNGPWQPVIPTDGAFDSAAEEFYLEAPLYDGTHLLEFRAVNTMDTSSTIQQVSVTVSDVGSLPIYIVDTPALTRNAAITLTISAPVPTEALQISSDPHFSDTVWQPFTRHPVFTREGQADGSIPIYIRFRDATGHISSIYTRQVLLDTTPPTGQVVLDSDLNLRALVSAEDHGSGVALIEIEINAGEQRWQIQAPEAEITAVVDRTRLFTYHTVIELPASTTSIRVCFQDAAGNVSPYVQASIEREVIEEHTQQQVFLPLILAAL